MKRALVIGLDGVPAGLLKKLIDRGLMPQTGSLLQGAAFFTIPSTIPPLSSVAWTTVLTGTNPGEHGIFGFVELDPLTYRYKVNALYDVKAPLLWDMLGSAGKRCAFLNVPATYPAPPVNGILVSGFVAPELERAVWPRALSGKLRKWGYRVDVDAKLAHQEPEAFLRHLNTCLERRRPLIRYVLESEAWDFAMVVFTETDRLLHFFYDAVEDPAHRFHSTANSFFETLDEAIAETEKSFGRYDLLVMLSDHGFGRLRFEVYTNMVLEELGFAGFADPSSGDLTSLEPQSRAFALDPARIYVHLEGRFARGSVKEADRVVNELAKELSAFSIEGRRAVRRVFRRSELYRGGQVQAAPDLVVLGSPGLDWKGRVGTGKLCAQTVFTGYHTQPDAFLAVTPPPDTGLLQEPDLTSVVPLVLSALGVDPPGLSRRSQAWV